MPHRDDPQLKEMVEKAPAKEGTVCRWCRSPIIEWDQYAESVYEYGMHIHHCCPECGHTDQTRAEETLEGCLYFMLLVLGFTALYYVTSILS